MLGYLAMMTLSRAYLRLVAACRKLCMLRQDENCDGTAVYQLASDGLRGLHLSCAMCPFLAVVRVNSAPHRGHVLLEAVPDFSRWCRNRLLNVENCRPLHPCSQHWGFGRELITRGITGLPWVLGDEERAGTDALEAGTLGGESYAWYAVGAVLVGGYMVGNGWYSLTA